MVKVAMCMADRESNFHPDAYNPNSGASGVFQFIPSTWAWASKAAGYGDHADPFDAKKNIGTAAWVVAGTGGLPGVAGAPEPGSRLSLRVALARPRWLSLVRRPGHVRATRASGQRGPSRTVVCTPDRSGSARALATGPRPCRTAR
jgi:hypothetical protein